MAFELGLAVLERAVAHLQGTAGDACERLVAASAELEDLGDSAAVPAGLLTEVADFRRRVNSGQETRSEQECAREAERIMSWLERLRAVIDDGAVGDSGPVGLERSTRQEAPGR